MLPENVVLFGPVPGGMEMVVILLIAVLLFGANKIPKLARSTGEAMGEFQKGRQEVEKELEEMQEPTSIEGESSDSDDSLNLDSEESSGGSSSP
jgi:sec-independent protein translocase protein TatA